MTKIHDSSGDVFADLGIEPPTILEAYQRGRREALEEAAKVAESMVYTAHAMNGQVINMTIPDIPKAIRALKDKANG
jgi:hypothetical protein